MAGRIRRATLDDAAALLALEQHFPGDRMSRRSIRHLLRSASAAVWVAERDGGVLGALILLLHRGTQVARIYSVVVSPASRGEGLGRQLVETAERHARDGKKALVSLEVREDNRAALALYRRLGYNIGRRLPGYYEDGTDGLRLTKPLFRLTHKNRHSSAR